MALLKDIVSHSNELLMIDRFNDYCPNGLQVEGKSEVKKIVSGVTASQALIDTAISKDADLILVHHGYFWRGESQPIVGLKKNRIAALINNNISLLTYHLPLDAHETMGNNAQLAQLLGLTIVGQFGPDKLEIGVLAAAQNALAPSDFFEKITASLGRSPQFLSSGGLSNYQTVALCTGAAQAYFEHAIKAGANAFVTGEVSEQCYHLAMESGVDFYAAGHHATERYGVQALGNYLAAHFNILHEYVEIPNPV